MSLSRNRIPFSLIIEIIIGSLIVLATNQNVICLHILHKCILMKLKVGYAFSLRFGSTAIKKIHNIPDFMELKPSGAIDKQE